MLSPSILKQVTKTLDPADDIGMNVGRGLSERLSAARAKSTSELDESVKSHTVKLSTDRTTGNWSFDIVEVEEEAGGERAEEFSKVIDQESTYSGL